MVGGVSPIHELFVRRAHAVGESPQGGRRADAADARRREHARRRADRRFSRQRACCRSARRSPIGYGFASAAMEFDLHARRRSDAAGGLHRRARSTIRSRCSARSSGAGAEAEFERAFDATKARLAPAARLRRLQRPAGGTRPGAHRAEHARLHPDQPQRPGPATRLAHLQPLVDPRRRHDLGRAARDGLHPGGARLHPLVRRLPVCRTARFRAASTATAPIRCPSTTATANSSTPSPSTTATRATSAS